QCFVSVETTTYMAFRSVFKDRFVSFGVVFSDFINLTHKLSRSQQLFLIHFVTALFLRGDK
ncbi:hypothetical protein, partial [Guptibacillus hwajinpoensis]